MTLNWLIENWIMVFIVIALIGAVFTSAKKFICQSTEEQIARVKKWLLWAVTEAEKELGSGTGKLKLTSVYDMFVQRFPWVAKVITFERFSALVDEVLEDMRNMLKQNKAVAEYVENNQ